MWVTIVEHAKKEKWAQFRDRHGDAGRDVVLWAGRRFSGMKLTEFGESAGGMDYSAVAVAIIRLLKQSGKDRKLRRLMKYVARECQK